jgi:hypothetical protein
MRQDTLHYCLLAVPQEASHAWAGRIPPLGCCVDADLLLLQGVVESRTLEDNRGLKYTMVLFSRRSRLHPGMRYIARGLNNLASPGNEIECEQVPLRPAE